MQAQPEVPASVKGHPSGALKDPVAAMLCPRRPCGSVVLLPPTGEEDLLPQARGVKNERVKLPS